MRLPAFLLRRAHKPAPDWRLAGGDVAAWARLIEQAALFDPTWYLRRYPDARWGCPPPLQHYLLHGGFHGRDPNPFFDSRWYLKRHAEAAASGLNPLVHYALDGARRGLAAGPRFDGAAYLAAYPQAEGWPTPLSHFLRVGRRRGLTAFPPRDRPARPDWAAFEALARERMRAGPAGDPSTDVVLPAYRGLDETLAAIHSVLAAPQRTAFEFIVMDDASPEPELASALDRLAGMGLFALHRNERNIGFVATVNRAMRLHPARDVVLLNSDAEVYGDWLDRLRAHGRPGVATVTPFSNNATICSYPKFDADNPLALELSYAELDRLCAQAHSGRSLDIPTGVGFCLFVSRAALDAVGPFDEAAFGQGYGEENDFCRRAAALGWRNVQALDIFVRHTGEASFQGVAPAQRRKGLAALARKHPAYLGEVKAFAAADPALPWRRRLDALRLRRAMGGGPVTLAVSHVWGGGIERHLKDEAARLSETGATLLTLAPSPRDRNLCGLSAPFDMELPNLRGFSIARERDELARLLRALGVARIDIHSLAGWPYAAIAAMPELARDIGAPLGFAIHDYAAICPLVNLIGPSGIYCGEPDERACRACLGKKSHPMGLHLDAPKDARGAIDIGLWRRDYGALLAGADGVWAPSADAARRMMRRMPGLSVETRPHVERLPGARRVAAPYSGGTVRVAVIGAIGAPKGSQVLLDCARDAARRRLDLEFAIVGYANNGDRLGRLANIRMTGAYDEARIFDALEAERPHVAFFASVWPETYSYTLSIALAAGFPIAAFDIGAIAERLAGRGRVRLLPLETASLPAAINSALIALARETAAQPA